MNKGFTLIELVVVIAVTAVLSGIILFTVTQYIGKGKDSNISGNLAILIPAGEVFYNGNGSSYNDGLASFCNPQQNSVLKNIISQMPDNPRGCSGGTRGGQNAWTATSNPAGVCCITAIDGGAWAACASKFTNCPGVSCTAFCVDSMGRKKEIPVASCTASTLASQCPEL